MAAFSTSFQTVLENDIRHMYSYNSRPLLYRKRKQYKERVHPTIPLRKRYPRRFYDLYEDMNIGIPRAPAFREVNDPGLEDIIERLRKPILCQSKSGRMRCKEKIDRKYGVAHEQEPKNLSKEEVDAITRRLRRSTKCSRNRNAEREDSELHLPPINLRNTVGRREWMN